jgi:hypothetical protein
MLDHAIEARTLTKEDAHRLGVVLAGFYRTAPVVAVAAVDYRGQMADEIRMNRRELGRPGYLLPLASLDAVTAAQLRFMENEPASRALRVLDAASECQRWSCAASRRDGWPARRLRSPVESREASCTTAPSTA